MAGIEQGISRVHVENGREEQLGKAKTEVRFASLDCDAARVADLFLQPSTIGHLSGIAPTEKTSEVNVKRYAEKYPALNIAIATEESVKDLYKSYEGGGRESNIVLLVAEEKETRLLVGTITVERPTAPGLTYASISGVRASLPLLPPGIVGPSRTDTASAGAQL